MRKKYSKNAKINFSHQVKCYQRFLFKNRNRSIFVVLINDCSLIIISGHLPIFLCHYFSSGATTRDLATFLWTAPSSETRVPEPSNTSKSIMHAEKVRPPSYNRIWFLKVYKFCTNFGEFWKDSKAQNALFKNFSSLMKNAILNLVPFQKPGVKGTSFVFKLFSNYYQKLRGF